MDGLSGEANDVVDSDPAGENAVASRIDAMIAACLSLAFTKRGTSSRFITHRFKYSKFEAWWHHLNGHTTFVSVIAPSLGPSAHET